MTDSLYPLSVLGRRKFDDHVRVYGDASLSFVEHFAHFQRVIATQAVVRGKPQPPPWYWRPVPIDGDDGTSLPYYAIDFMCGVTQSVLVARKALVLP